MLLIKGFDGSEADAVARIARCRAASRLHLAAGGAAGTPGFIRQPTSMPRDCYDAGWPSSGSLTAIIIAMRPQRQLIDDLTTTHLRYAAADCLADKARGRDASSRGAMLVGFCRYSWPAGPRAGWLFVYEPARGGEDARCAPSMRAADGLPRHADISAGDSYEAAITVFSLDFLAAERYTTQMSSLFRRALVTRRDFAGARHHSAPRFLALARPISPPLGPGRLRFGQQCSAERDTAPAFAQRSSSAAGGGGRRMRAAPHDFAACRAGQFRRQAPPRRRRQASAR